MNQPDARKWCGTTYPTYPTKDGLAIKQVDNDGGVRVVGK